MDDWPWEYTRNGLIAWAAEGVGAEPRADAEDLYKAPTVSCQQSLVSLPQFTVGTHRNMADTKEHPQPAPASPTHVEEKKAKPGAGWKDNETHVLPKNNLPVVFAALGLCTFLAALDQVSLPSWIR